MHNSSIDRDELPGISSLFSLKNESPLKSSKHSLYTRRKPDIRLISNSKPFPVADSERLPYEGAMHIVGDASKTTDFQSMQTRKLTGIHSRYPDEQVLPIVAKENPVETYSLNKSPTKLPMSAN